MNRFQEETAATLAGNSARHRFADDFACLAYEAQFVECPQCKKQCKQLFHVPEFEIEACAECYAEGMAQIAADAEYVARRGMARADAPCSCIAVDADQVDARYCEAHGEVA